MPVPYVDFIESENGQPCHKYMVDGLEVPGLSYILKSNGFINYDKIKDSVMEAARERGDAAHYATRLYDEDNPGTLAPIDAWEKQALDEPMDDWTRSRLTGWVKFRKDLDFHPIIIEKPMSHTINGMTYAFTPDRYGRCAAGAAVVEVKCTAQIMPSHRLQLALQAPAFQVEGVKLFKYVVQLLENDYKIHDCKDRMDDKIAMCALAATVWKWNEGIR